MPKKKTGQRKKKEKQREVQKNIQAGRPRDDFKTNPANQEMICDQCQRRQKSRFACYFCSAIQKMPQCSECGRIKCTSIGGDCMIKHFGKNVTGMAFVGAICDFCENIVCHSRKCLQSHACSCILRIGEDVVECIECERNIWEHGGRGFRCATCSQWLCEDDQFEHQASCQILESETYRCTSCNRLGTHSCLRCKICFCADHVKGHTFNVNKLKKGQAIPCKKCGYELQETKDLSMSVRRYAYGRRRADDEGMSTYYGRGNPGYGNDNSDFASPSGRYYGDSDDSNDSNWDEDDDEDNEDGSDEEEETE